MGMWVRTTQTMHRLYGPSLRIRSASLLLHFIRSESGRPAHLEGTVIRLHLSTGGVEKNLQSCLKPPHSPRLVRTAGGLNLIW